jgi:ATP phosphoribosyltransferase
VNAEVEFPGATEVKALELVDAIVEITEIHRFAPTAADRRHLACFDATLDCQSRGLKNGWKRQKMESSLVAQRGFVRRQWPEMNVEQKNPANLLQSLPALRNPTVSNLSLQDGWRWRQSSRTSRSRIDS